jgi:hypothetical protein
MNGREDCILVFYKMGTFKTKMVYEIIKELVSFLNLEVTVSFKNAFKDV